MGSIDTIAPPQTSHHLYPPFATNVPTAPLTTISLAALESDTPAESAALFAASKGLGFFYLDTAGSALGAELVREAEALLAVQKEFFARESGEKEAFARERVDAFFGYRWGVVKAVEGGEDGEERRNETYNVSLAFAYYYSTCSYYVHWTPPGLTRPFCASD